MNLDELLRQVDQHQDELVALEQALVRIPSINTGVMPTGNETPVCELVAKKLAEAGIDSQILESAPGRGNLAARLPGSLSSPKLLFMAHTDVVPVENESDWQYPPFGGEVHNGRVHGRGSHDMKGILASEIMAMLILKRSGTRLAGDLMLAACADEEAGGTYGAGWLAKTNPELVQADFAINEGGGTPVKTAKGLVYFLTLGEKGRYEVHITVEGRSWHASQPWRADNPLFKVATVLQRIRDYRPQIDTSAPLFAHLQELYNLPQQVSNENVDEMLDILAARDPSESASLKALSRMTLVPTMISGGVKSNSIAERIMLTCDIRCMPSQDTGYVQGELQRLLDGIPGVSFELIRTAIPSASRGDIPFADAVRRATARAIGRDDFAWVPGLTAGFTDSRLVRPLGNIVYDFCPSQPDVDGSLYGAHNRNESQDIASLLTQTRMLVALAWDVLQGA
jgi:acetylornithine deacetylase/succinyl-diaminopimelate desuccinylase-like protein